MLNSKYLFKQSFSFTPATINAGAVGDTSVNIGKSGYTPVAITNWRINTGGGCALVHIAILSDTEATIRLVNTKSTANQFTQASWIQVMYVKN